MYLFKIDLDGVRDNCSSGDDGANRSAGSKFNSCMVERGFAASMVRHFGMQVATFAKERP